MKSVIIYTPLGKSTLNYLQSKGLKRARIVVEPSVPDITDLISSEFG
jgi:hypothetical protein